MWYSINIKPNTSNKKDPTKENYFLQNIKELIKRRKKS